MTPEVEVGVGRRPRLGRKAEAEPEQEAEPGELPLVAPPSPRALGPAARGGGVTPALR